MRIWVKEIDKIALGVVHWASTHTEESESLSVAHSTRREASVVPI